MTLIHPVFLYISEIKKFTVHWVHSLNDGNKKSVYNCDEDTLWNTVRIIVLWTYRKLVLVI